MLADFYNKPLQGRLFRYFRKQILNLPKDETNDIGSAKEKAALKTKAYRAILQECVENDMK